MFGISKALSYFINTIVRDGATALGKVVKQYVRAENEKYAYCKQRLDRLTKTSVWRGGQHYIPFGGRFSTVMPRMAIRSRRAQRIDAICEQVVKGRDETVLAQK